MSDTLPTAVAVTGPAGSGATTFAHALARSISATGRKSVVLTVTETAGAGEDELETGCYRKAVCPEQIIADTWARGLGEAAVELAALAGLASPQPRDLLTLQLARDLAKLSALQLALTESRWDAVIVDFGPEMLDSLAAPERLLVHLNRFLTTDARLARATRAGGAGVTDPLIAWLPGISRYLRELGEVTSAQNVRNVLITTPDESALARAASALTAHGLFQRPVSAVVVNKVVPFGGDPWRSAVAADQRTAITAFGRSRSVPVLELEHRPGGEGVRVGDFPLDVVVPECVPTANLRPVKTAYGYQLSFELPGISRDQVTVKRRGDDLVLRVAGIIREVPLSAGLRRCRISAARLRDGVLTISFEPDPSLWRERNW